ncbi:tetratricopeptide repeat protein [Streptomyces yangpuensis]|uniref:tetratricopeptide repeat protein n=1 Tax=Streptomyces yangpuensis TaxID=1648182 RepID=UPI00363E87B8
MTTLTHEEIVRGLAENRQAPNGAARNAHAEALAGAAEAHGDRALFREALDNLINAYLYSSESPKILVPFARLLQEYDKDPAAFSEWETHSLFWQFKWVATAIADSPGIPLDSATGWLDEMERRYRLAGYSERPVRDAELWLAHATGDDERAERAFRSWLAAERDDMSDCEACELGGQGHYAILQGDDAGALELWQPVLEGELVCAEEPHRVLAASLLPLLRLGRTDEARSHHLRGYRMARGNDSLLPSVGRHIEFCALTGNTARGLEILAEHASHVAPLSNLDDRLAFHGGILVLLHRLRDLGHGDLPAVSYEGTPRTVSELYEVLYAGCVDIAGQFDARNGTTRVSDRFLARVVREPLAADLPLGVRTAGLPRPATPGAGAALVDAVSAPAGPGTTAATPVVFTELVARARRARDLSHPGTDALWAEVAVRLEAQPEADPLVRADLADQQALAAARHGAQDARELLTAVRDEYRALGRAERAALAELRLAGAAAQSAAAPAEIRALLRAALRSAEALDHTEPLRARRIALAELSAIRLESYLRTVETTGPDGHHDHGHHHAGGQEHGHAELAAELTAFAAARREAAPDLVAEAEEMLGQVALAQGDPERAVPLLATSAERAVAAGRPWQAVDPLVLRAGVLMSLDRTDEAEQAARTALEHASELTDAEAQAVVRLTLADVLLRRGGTGAEAAAHALTAAHWFDRAGLGADGGAQARLVLARAYARDERAAEAAEVLQSALPDLLEHGDGQTVSVREFLGDLLRRLGELRPAAEQYLLAAEVTKGWEDPRPQASLAQSAADALNDAGLAEEAVAAYERALELHRRTAADPVAEVRVLRSLAWLGLREEITAATVDGARGRMGEAAAVLEAALAADPGAPALRSELAQTWHQLAQVLDRYVSTALPADGDASTGPAPLSPAEVDALRLEEIELWDRAGRTYAELGPGHLRDRFQCLNNAAWTEQERDDAEAAAARVSALIEEARGLPEDEAPDWLLPSAERLLEQLNSRNR